MVSSDRSRRTPPSPHTGSPRSRGHHGTEVRMVCHANRCVLADPDGDESPATAVAGRGTAVPVLCHPTAVLHGAAVAAPHAPMKWG
jgi:hypothetical protein